MVQSCIYMRTVIQKMPGNYTIIILYTMAKVTLTCMNKEIPAVTTSGIIESHVAK